MALFVDRWLRRANRASALAARRKAEAQAQMAIEREALLHRFRAASNVFAALAAVALVYALVFRPIDTPPKTYAAPERAERAEHVRSVDPADALNLSAYEIGTAIRMQDGWLYAAAKLPKVGVLMRMQPDGSGMNEVLDVAGGEITDLALCAGRHPLDDDDRGRRRQALPGEQRPVGRDRGACGDADRRQGPLLPGGRWPWGRRESLLHQCGGVSVKYGLESALRHRLLAHTGHGLVYV